MDILAFLLVTALVFGGGVVFGLAVAEESGGVGEHLTVRDATVRADMDALAQLQQLNTAFVAARDAMWEEAARHSSPEVR
ncbi:hypothetical protein RB614_00935 [Phytohabitans sp. ZYX-F-186]|uniref:Uncharacterized protein n=1 Tax=Phytohabitans maris TaxID=3071409 RepID=A0ABU0Z7Q0_9ACTN|nr:hypothetical protein [Phytohabitans sp. ZYX-F-186]MDQ7903085.1 hypothetical protein [Phytohabitans sp. ZYX-F-186]